MNYISKSLSDLPFIAKKLIKKIGDRKVVAINAEMGAGKTTLIKHLIKLLSPDDFSGSPTYAIANEYLSYDRKKICHLDLYRINNIEELFDIGIDNYLQNYRYCFIEWPEKSISFFPNDTFWVYIRIEEDQSRTIQIKNDHKS